MDKKKRFNQIVSNIKKVKIQGATNIAKNALYAYSLIPTQKSKKKLLSARPTEPMLEKVLDMVGKKSSKEILKHFKNTQDKINKSISKLIKNNDVIFTHCHSTSVVNALIHAKKQKKKFEVYNTETRPIYQGRKTAKELKKAKIKVTMFVDSALGVALLKEQGTKKTDKIFLGADALTKKGIINKIGSNIVAQIAQKNKIPIYIVADSWKFTSKKLKLEQRSSKEIWKKILGIKIQNPAFEFIPKKHIRAIISEFGVLSYDKFLRKV
jgi:translation initiation factor 2B subunit (eIF-2B alpha/beta/delta family)